MSELLTVEKNKLKLGFVALLDCAPLVVAREKGFFEKYNLNVVLCKEASWASIRDKVSFGLYDGAHMLAPMPLAATLGLNGNKTAMLTALSLSQNGTAITLSKEFHTLLSKTIDNWEDDKLVGEQFKKQVKSSSVKPVMATVYPYSNHYYQLRYWLEQHGIDAEHDVQLIAVPPTQMIPSLSNGAIDGYCVGEPWNSLALIQKIGGLLTTGHKIWGAHTEKVLGVTQEWAAAYPNTHQALVKALYEACQWVEDINNKEELYQLLALPPYLDQAATKLSDYTPPLAMEQHFAGATVNIPDPKQGIFILEQMKQCGQLSNQEADFSEISHSVYRHDLFQHWIS
ncbi:CmpA/NrtA family ABC transporter substrate-binding protein [Neptuniibacter sp. 1_MG-2023]|uniref:CmpA/NrtA family ABC transporter substrate-binding protein n=1 Tax=Neptuniibacter sp. 1_MG-2023 TaxID=3062662 RepID=UPI0026E2DF0E|nr:CmpA/NrtA family ABC transporter substrate-binding protein [Neptuniibacter sp. 1_MG-2023]MDO6592546.1 CmpA/NrtA family ABC transporter substrate-binding protein [Neptuniibacter sp. 1_MG-2023]